MDRIGIFQFVKLDRPPQRVCRMWDVTARAGVDGQALWATGDRGEPFTVRSLAVALTFPLARMFLGQYKALELQGPVEVSFGTVEFLQLYKVLRVELVSCQRIVGAKIANDPLVYQALVEADWDLLPISPLVTPPS